MSTICKIVRFLGVAGAGWIVWGLIMAAVLSVRAGSGLTPGYVLTVTIPYGLWAVFLALQYSKIRDGLWTAAFTLLCLSGAYVCLYVLTHLPPENWLTALPFLLLFLSQPAVIWLSRRRLPNPSAGPAGTLPGSSRGS